MNNPLIDSDAKASFPNIYEAFLIIGCDTPIPENWLDKLPEIEKILGSLGKYGLEFFTFVNCSDYKELKKILKNRPELTIVAEFLDECLGEYLPEY